MNKLSIKAEKRKLTGRKVKRLRREGIIPANLFGKRIKSESIQVERDLFLKVFKEVGETGVVELLINGDKKPVLIHNVQLDPVTDDILHVDFRQIDLKEKISARIPVELVGESPAEKQGLGTVVQYIDEIEVEALPSDLPDKFEINLGVLVAVDQTVCVKDLTVDKEKVEIKADGDQIIIKVEPPKEEKEVEVPLEKEVVSEEAPPSEGEVGKEEEAQQETQQQKE